MNCTLPRLRVLLPVLLLAAVQAAAVPARSGWLESASSGLDFRYRLVGDEFLNWVECEEGYTLLRGAEGLWRYAEAGEDGGIRPGPRLYVPGLENGPAEARGLRPEAGWIREHVDPLRRMRDELGVQRVERVEGQWNLLLIMIHFPDQQPQYPPGNFDAMMNEPGYDGTGSFNDYYVDQSYGRYSTVSTVTSWYEAEHPHDYYGYDQGWEVSLELVVEAVYAADEEVDFSLFDNSGNGWVDALLIVHSGAGAEEGNQSNIWSHRWALWGYNIVLDGVHIYDYTMQPEMQGGGQAAIGVYVHEFGHNLGLPDLYDTDYSSSGQGSWCVMAGGSWGGGGAGGGAHTPVSFSAWCRRQLEWATETTTATELVDYPLPASYLSDEILRLDLEGYPQQYFLVENRQLQAWDRHQPAGGLLIFHVDEGQESNQNENRYLVDLEQADGMRELNQGLGADSGDPFPGSAENREFAENTDPSSIPYGGSSSEVSVHGIPDPADTMRATFFQIFSHQDLVQAGWELLWDSGGDLWLDPGEEAELVLQLLNRGSELESLELTLHSAEGLQVLDSTAVVLEVGEGEIFGNSMDPFLLRADESLPPGNHRLRLGSIDDGGWYQEIEVGIAAGRAEVLLVNQSPEPGDAAYYTGELEELGRTWEERLHDGANPAPQDLNRYEHVLWFSGTREAPLGEDEQSMLVEHLQSGGRLLLSGQHLLDQAGTEFQEVLGCTAGYWHQSGPLLRGMAAGRLFNDPEQALLFGGEGAWNQEFPTRSLSWTESRPILGWQNDGLVSAVRREVESGPDEPGRALLLAFSLESVHGVAGYLTRAEMLERMLSWLQDGSYAAIEAPAVRPGATELSCAPNPFNPVTTVEFRLGSPGEIRLEVYNLLGRRILERSLGLLPAGLHHCPLDLAGRASGIYIVELRSRDRILDRGRALLIR